MLSEKIIEKSNNRFQYINYINLLALVTVMYKIIKLEENLAATKEVLDNTSDATMISIKMMESTIEASLEGISKQIWENTNGLLYTSEKATNVILSHIETLKETTGNTQILHQNYNHYTPIQYNTDITSTLLKVAVVVAAVVVCVLLSQKIYLGVTDSTTNTLSYLPGGNTAEGTLNLHQIGLKFFTKIDHGEIVTMRITDSLTEETYQTMYEFLIAKGVTFASETSTTTVLDAVTKAGTNLAGM